MSSPEVPAQGGTKRPREEEASTIDQSTGHDPSRVKMNKESSGSTEEGVPPNNKPAKPAWHHDQIPHTAHYHVSWMHAAPVTHCVHAAAQGVVITAATDGVVKFWKRQGVANKDGTANEPLEFAKAFTAHQDAVVALCVADHSTGSSTVSSGGSDWAASMDAAGHVQFYHVSVLDAPGRLHLGHEYQPPTANAAATWVQCGMDQSDLLVVAMRHGPMLVANPTTLSVVQTLWVHGHDTTVTAMVYNPVHQCVLSGDDRGMLQLWDTHGDVVVVQGGNADNDDDDDDPGASALATHEVQIGAAVTPRRNQVSFQSRLETQLLYLHQKQTHAVSMAVTPDGSHYVVYGADHRIRLFVHQTGNVLCTYDERLKIYQKTYDKKPYYLDALEYGRRQALAQEMDQVSAAAGSAESQSSTSTLATLLPPPFQLQFESTEGRYLLVPTLMGIKVIDWQRHKLVKLVGSADAAQHRFVGLVQCPGPAKVDAQLQLARQQAGTAQPAQSAQEESDEALQKITDALLVAWSYKSRRFFVFSHFDPILANDNDNQTMDRRDHWNEAPDAADAAAAATSATGAGTSGAAGLATSAVLHTTMGDITVQLFAAQTPKTVENFGTHARNGYYDNVTFHRVIKNFMLQTGDPQGDGTGGEVCMLGASLSFL